MVFSSMVFLWIFLPIVMAVYFIIPKKFISAKNIVLLIASLLFYAWGEPVYVLLMLLSILFNYSMGILLYKLDCKKLILVIDILGNLLVLGYYKYYDFLIDSINGIFGTEIPLKDIALPIGISFFTFQILSYIIDLYRGEIELQKNPINLALYISFFPQLIAGPIVKYHDISKALESREQSLEQVSEGVRRFIYGFAKKVLIANVLARTVDNIYALDISDVTSTFAWVAAVFYMLQIYYDFSGYSDMAIGLGKIFGFNFNENFNYPYMSWSIKEFWRRWHISLSSWFRDYLYIPLGGNRKGAVRTYINLIIVFFVTGLWHGAGYTFILWGLFHGLFSILERTPWGKVVEKIKPLGFIYSTFVVLMGWVLFRADTIQMALEMYRRMFGFGQYTESTYVWQEIMYNRSIATAVAAVLGCGFVQAILKKTGLDKKLKDSYLEIVWLVIILLLSIASLAANSYNPFIYFRF